MFASDMVIPGILLNKMNQLLYSQNKKIDFSTYRPVSI